MVMRSLRGGDVQSVTPSLGGASTARTSKVSRTSASDAPACFTGWVTEPPISPDDTPAADFARPLLEQQLAELSVLAEMGMGIAGRLRDQVVEAPEPDAAPVDPAAVALAFSRVSRAIRLTFALQTVVIDKLRGVGRIEDGEVHLARIAAEDAAKASVPEDQEDPRLTARKAEIGSAITGIIREIHKDAVGGEAHERCVREATERLKDADDLGDILARPINEVIAQICRELGLSRASVKSPSPWMGEGSRVGVAPFPEGALMEKPRSPSLTPNPVRSPKVEPLPPPIPALSPIQGERKEPPPYTPPPDPDALPGYPVGLPGELPPNRRRPDLPPRNYTHGWD